MYSIFPPWWTFILFYFLPSKLWNHMFGNTCTIYILVGVEFWLWKARGNWILAARAKAHNWSKTNLQFLLRALSLARVHFWGSPWHWRWQQHLISFLVEAQLGVRWLCVGQPVVALSLEWDGLSPQLCFQHSASLGSASIWSSFGQSSCQFSEFWTPMWISSLLIRIGGCCWQWRTEGLKFENCFDNFCVSSPGALYIVFCY